ncbi:hypothetical protein ALC57_00042, partial [Trachymyrmex cornetzi]
ATSKGRSSPAFVSRKRPVLGINKFIVSASSNETDEPAFVSSTSVIKASTTLLRTPSSTSINCLVRGSCIFPVSVS